MCGIFGYFDQNCNNSLPYSVIEDMGRVIEHRGPDGQGIFYDTEKAVSLGNQRLAILDIADGDQPFVSDNGKVIVVQNGEIFNHVELAEELREDGVICRTHCDTEVILRLYERDGIAGLSKLNGMFAIAIYDFTIDSIFLVRDRVGEKPLYYSFDNGRLLFASEIKSILKARDTSEVDFEALNDYLSFNYVPVPRTLFSGIEHVEPGTYLKIDRSSIMKTTWWDIGSTVIRNKPESEWKSELLSTLDDAVKIRLRADVPFGAFLSGGVDSSTVVGLMSKNMSTPVKTYCIGFDDPNYDESNFALQAAQRFQAEHKAEIVNPNMLSLWPKATYHSDQPHGDVSFLPTYRVAELASKDVKMVLTGDGADELFAGYDKYKNFFSHYDMNNDSDEKFYGEYSMNLMLFSPEELSELFLDSTRNKICKLGSCYSKVKALLDEVPSLDRINQALYIDTKLLLSGNNLVKPDRMGMAVSIENRAPFLDYRIVELAFSMPGNMKLYKGETKYIYKRAVSDLIGDELAYRDKQMFTVPVGDWFKTTLRGDCEELLLGERSISINYFCANYVERLISDHCDDIENNTRKIRALIAFEHWCREFINE